MSANSASPPPMRSPGRHERLVEMVSFRHFQQLEEKTAVVCLMTAPRVGDRPREDPPQRTHPRQRDSPSASISVTGVTKATLGLPAIANTLLRGGRGLHFRRLPYREHRIDASRCRRVSADDAHSISDARPGEPGRSVHADVSFNTEIARDQRALGLPRQKAGNGHTPSC